MHAGRPQAPAGPPSLDLLEDLDADTVQTPERRSLGGDPGASPLDPHAFDPPAPAGHSVPQRHQRGDRTLRIDLATPAGLPRLESPRPPPLPATKPARPLRPHDAPPPLPIESGTPTPMLLRTPVSNPIIEMTPDEAIFDIDVTGIESMFAAHDEPDAPTGPIVSVPTGPASGRNVAGLALAAPLPVGVSTRDLSARPSAPAPAPLEVNLPCSVLVVDDDLRAGAQIAARLMEVGYTCRVTDLRNVQTVLAQQPFDVALVDVPADELRRDEGQGRIALMSPWSGPIVLTAPVLPAGPNAMPAQVRAVLSKPLLPTELIRTLEAARLETLGDQVDTDGPDFSTFETMPEETDVSVPVPIPHRPETEHPHDTRHEIPDGVRIIVTLADGRTLRSTVQDGSYGGRLGLELSDGIRMNVPVTVEVILLDGRRSDIPGRTVAPDNGAGIEIVLDLDPGDSVHFGRFLDEARDPSLPRAEALRVRERAAVEAQSDNIDQLWLSAKERLDDDGRQQAFIQACLRQQRMDFAIRSYRRLKDERPDDERVAKYLKQVGTILGFYALRKDQGQEDEVPSMSAGLKIAFGLFLLAALIFMTLALFLG